MPTGPTATVGLTPWLAAATDWHLVDPFTVHLHHFFPIPVLPVSHLTRFSLINVLDLPLVPLDRMRRCRYGCLCHNCCLPDWFARSSTARAGC